MDKVDWQHIETEYITTTTSYREIAEKYALAKSTVQLRGKRHQWNAKRKAYKESCIKKAVRKVENKESTRLANVAKLANQVLDVAAKALGDDDQFHRYLVTESRGIGESETVERVFKKVDTKALRDLAAVVKDLTGVIRNVYGLPTQAEAESQRIAAERLELEKKKVAAADGPAKGITIVFGDSEIEEWSE